MRVQVYKMQDSIIQECSPEEAAKVLEGLEILNQLGIKPEFDTADYLKKLPQIDLNSLIQTPN